MKTSTIVYDTNKLIRVTIKSILNILVPFSWLVFRPAGWFLLTAALFINQPLQYFSFTQSAAIVFCLFFQTSERGLRLDWNPYIVSFYTMFSRFIPFDFLLEKQGRKIEKKNSRIERSSGGNGKKKEKKQEDTWMGTSDTTVVNR